MSHLYVVMYIIEKGSSPIGDGNGGEVEYQIIDTIEKGSSPIGDGNRVEKRANINAAVLRNVAPR